MPESMNWSLAWPYFLAALAFGYLLGSIPFGVILTRIAGAGDLRQIGSGNIGATNVLRTGRKGLAAATLLLDMAKGAAAVLLAARLFPETVQIAAIGALVGHLWPVWLRFAGGKGVATYFGIVLGFALAGEIGWGGPGAFAFLWVGMSPVCGFAGSPAWGSEPTGPIAAGLSGGPGRGSGGPPMPDLGEDQIARLRLV